ncbi:MAG: hypothetical protein CSA81_06705 [Acidobacteria bacterium]|nr:MAG: hypothetical protein CSA81_06705 [Acidobacteriota bacterium]
MNDVVSCFPDKLKPFLATLVFMEAFILMTNGLMNTAIDYFNHSRHPGFSMAFFQTVTELPGVGGISGIFSRPAVLKRSETQAG